MAAAAESFEPTAPDVQENALQSIFRRYLFSEEAAAATRMSRSMFSAQRQSLRSAFQIARSILGRGAAFDKITVLLRQPKRYAPLIAESFRRAGIPVSYVVGHEVRRSRSCAVGVAPLCTGRPECRSNGRVSVVAARA